MLLFVGLGNPGPEYAAHRHNVGFMAVDEIVRRHDFAGWREKFRGALSPGFIGEEKILVLKPMTFMNRSGGAVAEAANFFRIAVEDVLVFHDDLDLIPGKIRVKRGGGHGGHNGLRDITAHLGAEFRRVRIGIGHPGSKEAVNPYVLRDFAKADRPWVTRLIEAMGSEIELLVDGADEKFMSRVAHLAPPPVPPEPEEKETGPDGI